MVQEKNCYAPSAAWRLASIEYEVEYCSLCCRAVLGAGRAGGGKSRATCGGYNACVGAVPRVTPGCGVGCLTTPHKI